MKTILLMILIGLGFQMVSAQGNRIKKSKENNIPAVISAKSVLLNSIDPAVTDLSFGIIKQNTGDKLRVKGTVRNIGGKDFESGEKQQMVQLWEIRSPKERQMLRQVLFSHLVSGQEIQISFEVPYPKKGKDQVPEYQVLIVYDPDILNDSNKSNDDTNVKNNSMTKKP